MCSQVLWTGLELMARMVRHWVNPICYVAHWRTKISSGDLLLILFVFLTTWRLGGSNHVALLIGCSCFQYPDQSSVLPCKGDVWADLHILHAYMMIQTFYQLSQRTMPSMHTAFENSNVDHDRSLAPLKVFTGCLHHSVLCTWCS